MVSVLDQKHFLSVTVSILRNIIEFTAILMKRSPVPPTVRFNISVALQLKHVLYKVSVLHNLGRTERITVFATVYSNRRKNLKRNFKL